MVKYFPAMAAKEIWPNDPSIPARISPSATKAFRALTLMTVNQFPALD
jgi:hypothetical protein